MRERTVLAWDFVGETLRDGHPIPADGVILGATGLRASRRIIDGLNHATGKTICRVRCAGEIVDDVDELICRSRTIIWRIDGSKVLRKFACQQALSVAHLWNMPRIVREYLETQDESKRAAACATAQSAVWATKLGLARHSAQASAWAASSERPPWTASASGASHFASYAAWSADSARAAANTMLTKMVMKEHKKNERQPISNARLNYAG